MKKNFQKIVINVGIHNHKKAKNSKSEPKKLSRLCVPLSGDLGCPSSVQLTQNNKQCKLILGYSTGIAENLY
jgi:hypothetical protein